MLQARYTIRSEALLVEALDYNLRFRWFLDLNLLDPVWDNSTFSQNQNRLLQHRTAELFFARLIALPANTAEQVAVGGAHRGTVRERHGGSGSGEEAAARGHGGSVPAVQKPARR